MQVRYTAQSQDGVVHIGQTFTMLTVQQLRDRLADPSLPPDMPVLISHDDDCNAHPIESAYVHSEVQVVIAEPFVTDHRVGEQTIPVQETWGVNADPVFNCTPFNSVEPGEFDNLTPGQFKALML